MKKFIIQSTILTIIVFAMGVLLYSTILSQYYLKILPFAVLFFYVVTNLVHAYLLKIAVNSGSRFTSRYMAASFVKMFFYLGVAIVFVILHREIAKTFIANFLALYVFYTAFEVYQISKFMKQKGN
ncbi:MAG: hypothetical protein WC384_08190 [Prolixibacteraceae bacterium]|jgi:uncharacterized protein (DUF58 family)